MTDEELARMICPSSPLDVDIAWPVHMLRERGIHTTESCQGGEGHAFPDPSIKIAGSHGEGWRALSVLRDYRVPVMHLCRTWDITHGEVDGPYWLVVLHPRRWARYLADRRGTS